MNRILLSATALLALATAASAADLPMRAPPPPPVAAVPVFTWTGFYVGVHGAWIRNDVDAVRSRVNGPAVVRPLIPRNVGLDDDGFGGGGQVGYLMQFGSIVAGVEADVTATDIGRTRATTRAFTGVPAAVQTRLGSDMDYLGTVKGRLGFSFPSFIPVFQQSMIYATGGLGYAGTDNRARLTLTAPGIGTLSGRTGRDDDTKFGFVVGGGTESAITNNISIKTETLYYNLEDATVTGRFPGVRARYRFENDGWISKVGLNVRFSSF